MKKTTSKIPFLLLSLLFSNLIFATPTPPQPAPPGPPGFPIDENILVLVIACLVLGFYKIYHTKKAS
ncbi:hypothetical protein [Flavobacterium aciduliphilum]|uniref:hypothetical protein n=1 Tax=Flavobacterium aciduliphilum TaxID=1101402 RepID=UPI000DD33485|nr:hypothetical protein [Flavobacterium aciduliphilum]